MKTYEKDKFDILIPCHEKDKETLKESIKYMKKNVLGYRKIFVLSRENYFPEDKNIIFINEKEFPFSKEKIGNYAPQGRAGWYYTQFLRLYLFKVLGKKVLDNVLTIDADTFFIRKTEFFKGKVPLYNVEIGHHQPYYDILEKILGFGKEHPKYSGTTHYMLFQRRYLNESLDLVKKKNGKELWKAVMENIDKKTESGFSEYDYYFNYMLKYHPEKIKIKKLNFIDFPSHNPLLLKICSALGYTYVSCHEYYRYQKFPVIKSFIRALLTRIGIKRQLKDTLVKSKIMKTK